MIGAGADSDSLGAGCASVVLVDVGGLVGSPEFLHMTTDTRTHPPFNRCAALMLIYTLRYVTTAQTTSGGMGTGTSGFAICVALGHITLSGCAVSAWFALLFYAFSENALPSPLCYPSGFRKTGSSHTMAWPFCTRKDSRQNQLWQQTLHSTFS